MLSRLEVRNFQSLKKVDLDLGQFTVIVGPSSSGKSGLIRACKALASNVRGSGIITRGQKRMAITGYADAATVTLERTEAASTYRLMLMSEGNEHVFTKLAGQVPEHITTALRIEPVPVNGTSVNFAAQFDRPYLLDDTGARVASELGELTNVTAIFEAVRSANKIRLSAASTLKTRKNDLTEVQERLEAFKGLQDRVEALDQAEELIAATQATARKVDRLQAALQKLQLAERTLSTALNLPEVPDAEPMTAAFTELLDFKIKLTSIQSRAVRLDHAENELRQAIAREEEQQKELADVLAREAVCPTCGQAM